MPAYIIHYLCLWPILMRYTKFSIWDLYEFNFNDISLKWTWKRFDNNDQTSYLHLITTHLHVHKYNVQKQTQILHQNPHFVNLLSKQISHFTKFLCFKQCGVWEMPLLLCTAVFDAIIILTNATHCSMISSYRMYQCYYKDYYNVRSWAQGNHLRISNCSSVLLRDFTPEPNGSRCVSVR